MRDVRPQAMSEFRVKLRRRNIPDEELLADMQRVASHLSKKSLTRVEYDANGDFGATTVLRKFKYGILQLRRLGWELLIDKTSPMPSCLRTLQQFGHALETSPLAVK